MDNNDYNKIKEESDKIEFYTQKSKQELSENLTCLVESLTKFIRFIDEKIEIERRYFFDTKKRVYPLKSPMKLRMVY